MNEAISLAKIDQGAMAKFVETIATALYRQTDIESDPEMIHLWLANQKSPKTRDGYQRDWDYFAAWIQGKELRSVTLKDLIGYQQALEGRGFKPATIRRKLNAVRSLLKFAVKAGYLHTTPGESLTLPSEKDTLAERILTEAQVLTMIALSKGRDRVLLRVLYASGGRVSEICGLKWRDCRESDEGAILTLFGKGAKTRSVVVSRETWGELLSLRKDADDDSPVLQSRKGKGHLDRSQVARIVAAAARRAGITGNVSPHWLRHSHGTHAVNRGVPISLIQATLGHSSIATTGRYLHANPKESSGLHLPV